VKAVKHLSLVTSIVCTKYYVDTSPRMHYALALVREISCLLIHSVSIRVVEVLQIFQEVSNATWEFRRVQIGWKGKQEKENLV